MRTATIALGLALFGIASIASAGAGNPSFLNFDADSSVQTPGHRVDLVYQTYGAGAGALAVRVYALPEDDVVAIAAGKENLDDGLVERLAPVARAGGVAERGSGWTAVDAPVYGLPIGHYVAVATLGDRRRIDEFSVGTLGMVYASAYFGEGGRRGVYYPADLKSFNRYPAHVEIAVRDDGGSRVLAENGGIVWFDGAAGEHAVMLARAEDGSSVAIPLERPRSDQPAPDVGMIQLDRPIFRPGDTVNVRAIVRQGTMGAYAIPAGTRRVLLRAPDGTVAYDHELALNGFGTVSAAIRLPQDAALGTYALTVGALQRDVLVQAYKKPEYALALANLPAYVVGGETLHLRANARYFFGRPAAGMQVRYTVAGVPHWYASWYGPYGSLVQSGALWNREGSETIAEGDATTDANGGVAIDVPTKAVQWNQDATVEIEARDASGRTVETGASVLLTQASITVWPSVERWFATAGTPSVVAVHARAYDGRARPSTLVHVKIEGNRWDGEAGREVDAGTQSFDVPTDARGDGTFSWTPTAGGTYTIVTSARDERGRTAAGSTYVWALAQGEADGFAPLDRALLIPERTSVAPGTRADVLVALPQADRDVLVLTTTDRLTGAQIAHVRGTAGTIGVAVPKDAKRMRVTILLPGENGVAATSTDLDIAPADKALSVALAPRKARYAPGERAVFDVRVRDAAGRPVRAELGIGIVDEAIYAVQQEDAADPLDVFYAGGFAQWYRGSWQQPNRSLKTIARVASSASLVRAGTTEDIYSVNAAQTGAAQVRSNFADTAYWNPSVVTGADGRATISFVWPDDLTTWRASGLAVTKASDVGRATGSALVTKDFLVRVETPRFLRAGDRSTIVGIAHGMADRPNVVMHLDARYLSDDPVTSSLRLDRFGTASASWPVAAPGVGTVALTLSGSDGARGDAMRRELTLEAGTAAEHVRSAGEFARNPELVVHVPPGYLAGDVHLTLAPSLVGELVGNQRLLDIYPYGCTEQTMSTALPDIFIERVMKRERIEPPRDVDPKAIVRHALARLAQLQHDDGAWGWWEHDAAHPFMTAYAVYGLAEFKRDGYAVPEQMFSRGVDSLVSQLASADGDTLAYWGGPQPNSAWNTRAFMLFALATAAPERIDRAILHATLAHAGDLNPYALSVLGLAEHELHDDRAARELSARLDAIASDDGRYVWWPGQTWDHRWMDDPIESTAYALRLEAATAPGSRRVERAVAFLRAQRNGDWWYTTKDTAAAIYALSDAMGESAGARPAQTVRVYADGRLVRELRVTTPVLDAADASIVVPASAVHDGTTIRFEHTGTGPFYWSSDAVRYVPTNADRAADAETPLLERIAAKAPALQVTRRYLAGHGGAWRVGDEVVVEVTVRSRDDEQYVAVEDPFPAGAEHQPEQGRAGDDAWDGIQLLDDRAVFFADRLGAGESVTLRYTLRVTTPGHYTAPAPTAYAMYGPPVNVLGRAQTVEVAP